MFSELELPDADGREPAVGLDHGEVRQEADHPNQETHAKKNRIARRVTPVLYSFFRQFLCANKQILNEFL